MDKHSGTEVITTVALLAEGVDRNKAMSATNPTAGGSPSSRRAWIEIRSNASGTLDSWVALLAEGVDRNQVQKYYEELARVALLAEGVDRNFSDGQRDPEYCTSPSSRRAWIEIA